MITAAGVGSGIDVESILSQLNTLQREPVEALNRKRAALDVELSAFGKVKSALSSFRSSVETMGSNRNFGGYAATSSDEEVLTATSNNGKQPESYDIEVVSLASNHRVASASYASGSAQITAGTYTFTSGGNEFSVTMGNGSATLDSLRDAINDSKNNTSVSANIINVDGGSRLVLTAKDAGTDNVINVIRRSGGPLGLSEPGGFDEVSAAKDASLIVHGFTVTSSSNTVTDAIEGMTLNLTGVGKSTVITERDTGSLRESIDDFVLKYNTMTDTLAGLSKKELQGDQLPRGIDNRMRAAFQSSIEFANGDSATAQELGFTFDKFGKLSLNESAFNLAIEEGSDRFVAAFSNTDTGLAARFSDLIDEYVGSGGVISIREDGVGTRKNTIDDQIDRLEYRLDKVSARLRAQFTAMDLVVSKLNNTSGFLASRLGDF